MNQMTHIASVDLVVESTPLSFEDRQEISDVIAHYKKTGEIIKINAKPSRKKQLNAVVSKAKLKKS